MQVVLKTEMEIHGNDLGSPTAEEMGPEDFDLQKCKTDVKLLQ